MDFYEKFCTFSNSHLLGIIENPDDYQPNAVLTAQKILESRNLSQEEINIALQENEGKKVALENKKRRKKGKIQSILNQMFDFINHFKPYSHSELTPNKTNKYIVVVMIIYVLLQLFELSKIMFSFYQTSVLDAVLILYFLPTIYLCVSIYFLQKQDKKGWYLLSFFGVYHIVFSLYSYLKYSGIPSITFRTSQGELFSAFFVWSCIVYTLNTKSIVEVYQLSKENRLISVSVSLIISYIVSYLIYV